MIINIEKVTPTGFVCHYTIYRVAGKKDQLLNAKMVFTPNS